MNKILSKEVSPELAKILKEKGFDIPCISFYEYSGNLNEVNFPQANISDFGTESQYYYVNQIHNWNEFKYQEEDYLVFSWDEIIHEYFTICCSAPTIAEVCDWIFKKTNIWIMVSITIQKEYYYMCIDITGKKDPTKNNYPSRICKPGSYYSSPLQAYEEAIKYILNKEI